MTQTTTQLRRYQLIEGTYDEFIQWWTEFMPTVRSATGFTIAFAYGVRETNEFVWAVSVAGGAEEFARVEAAYLLSDERAGAFLDQPDRILSQNNRLVDVVWPR